MIYAPIKYKKVNASSPLYLQCLSYSVAPASARNRYVNYSTEIEEQKISIGKTNVDNNDNSTSKIETFECEHIGKDNVVSPAKHEMREIKPICKQTAREKLKEFSSTFSQRFDAVFGEKLNATKEKMRAILGKEADEIKLNKTKNDNPITKKFKAKFEDFFSHDKEIENVQSESAFSKFKAKVKNMLNKNEKSNNVNAVTETVVTNKEPEFVEIDETLKQMALGVLTTRFDNVKVDKTFAAIAQNIQQEKEQQEFEDINKTLQQMALGVLPNRYDNVKTDKTFAAIAQYIQEEQSKKEFEEIDETFVAMSNAAKKEQALEEREAIRIANGGAIKESKVDSKTSSDDKKSNTAEFTPASALDDIAEIGESIFADSRPKEKDTLSQKLGRATAKIKEFFARKNKNGEVLAQSVAEDVARAEDVVQKNGNEQVIATQTSNNKVKTATRQDVDAESKQNKAEASITVDKTAETKRQVACETKDNGTHKRKSYYALKVENAKKHIINAGVRIRCAAKRFIYFFKDKFTAPEFVDYEDKDDYRKYGMKETRIAVNPETKTEKITPIDKTSTQTKVKTYKTTTLDYYFDL